MPSSPAPAEPIYVGLRLRPQLPHEEGLASCVEIHDNVVTLLEVSPTDAAHNSHRKLGGQAAQQFVVDVAMDSSDPDKEGYVSQARCYELVGKRVLEQTLEGYNTCLFCYGQTGTGKTTTIMGEPGRELEDDEKGILVRLLEDLFRRASKFQDGGQEVHMKVQMLELYNDRLVDLIAPRIMTHRTTSDGFAKSASHKRRASLKAASAFVSLKAASAGRKSLVSPEASLRLGKDTDSSPGGFLRKTGDPGTGSDPLRPEKFDKQEASQLHHKIEVKVHPEVGVYITGATEERVESAEDCLDLLVYGNSQKTIHATAMNAQSSRAHTIFKLSLDMQTESREAVHLPHLYFVDLAGYENERTTLVTGERKRELAFINTSLFELARCIQGLTRRDGQSPTWQRKKRQDLSLFRNSKLTLLLSSALTGNSRTSMIGTLSPAMVNAEGNLKTLMFVSAVKGIKLTPSVVNADEDRGALLARLEAEVRQLKAQLEVAQSRGEGPAPGLQTESTEEDLLKKEAQLASLGKHWVELKQEKRMQVCSRDRSFVRDLAVAILGAESEDSKEVIEAEEYMETLLGRRAEAMKSGRDSLEDEGVQEIEQEIRESKLFLRDALRAKKMVDRGNHLLADIAPTSGLSFQLATKSPPLAFGLEEGGGFPDLVVELVRLVSMARLRWHRAFQNLVTLGLLKLNAGAALQRLAQSPRHARIPSGGTLLCHMWTWTQFEDRLEILAKVHSEWAVEPADFILHRPRGIWADDFLQHELFPDRWMVSSSRRRSSSGIASSHSRGSNSSMCFRRQSRARVSETSDRGSDGAFPQGGGTAAAFPAAAVRRVPSRAELLQPVWAEGTRHNEELGALRARLDALSQDSAHASSQLSALDASLGRRLARRGARHTETMASLRALLERRLEAAVASPRPAASAASEHSAGSPGPGAEAVAAAQPRHQTGHLTEELAHKVERLRGLLSGLPSGCLHPDFPVKRRPGSPTK